MASRNFTWYCEPIERLRLTGVVDNEKPIHCPTAKALFPIVLVSMLSGFFHFLLRPLGMQVNFVSQMLAGISLGPTFLGSIENLNSRIFTSRTRLVINVMESFGLFYITFVTGVKVDLSIVKKCGRLGIVIGIGSFVLPLIVTSFMIMLLKIFVSLDDEFYRSLQMIIILESSIHFYVILEILTDMKLLNSELGRLALSASMINSLVALSYATVRILMSEIPKSGITSDDVLKYLSLVLVMAVIVFLLRPVMFWMMRQTPEGKSLKQEYILTFHIMIIGSFFVSEVTGILGFYGTVILGVATPLIPPMGLLLTDKIEAFVWSVFMPCFLINAGKAVNLFSVKLVDLLIIELFVWVSTSVKFCAIIVPSLYYKMPFSDALSLGLVMNCRGIYDIQMHSRCNRRKIISVESYSIMVLTSMLKSAIALPLLRVMYDTSRRYIAYKRRTIQHNRHDAELRILACIHEPTNVATIINFLGTTNNHQNPLGLYVLNLEEYVGCSLPVVIAHRLDKISTSKPTKTDIMLNAFRQFEQQSNSFVSVQCFTATAPYASMHEDICLMAFEKCTSMVIIPFQNTDTPFIKKMIKNVLKMAPCSVGILFDREAFMSRPIFTRGLNINVCVIFIGGSDDREALVYGARMAEDENIMLTIIRFFAVNHTVKDLSEEKQDFNLVSDLRISTIEKKNVKYIKHSVQEGSDTLNVINSIGNEFDLILIGRRHDDQSPALSGLAEWSEVDELGVIGDILASSDFKSHASIMVIQQQASVVEEMVVESPKFFSKRLK